MPHHTDADLAAFGDEYVERYADERASCAAGLDRLHPNWRDRVPFGRRAPRDLAKIKRLLTRWHQINRGNGDWGLVVRWRISAEGVPTKPYACAVRPAYGEDGRQVFVPGADLGGRPGGAPEGFVPTAGAEAFVQIIAPPLLADAMGIDLDDAIEALGAYADAIRAGGYVDRRPRRWVAAYLDARKPAKRPRRRRAARKPAPGDAAATRVLLDKVAARKKEAE